VAVSEEQSVAGPRVRISMDGQQLGNELTDNAYEDDGYRFHDVFHFAYAAVLGWSPVARAIIRHKRKSDPKVDEVEDGGRAAVIEEAVVALAFDYAKTHSFLKDVRTLDYTLLTILNLCTHGRKRSFKDSLSGEKLSSARAGRLSGICWDDP